jgi:hypothetical protein
MHKEIQHGSQDEEHHEEHQGHQSDQGRAEGQEGQDGLLMSGELSDRAHVAAFYGKVENAGRAIPRDQVVPSIHIEALPGGYVVTAHTSGEFLSPRRQVVPSLGALVSAIQSWAEERR